MLSHCMFELFHCPTLFLQLGFVELAGGRVMAVFMLYQFHFVAVGMGLSAVLVFLSATQNYSLGYVFFVVLEAGLLQNIWQ